MREILFRGKRLDNGEWVEGAYLNDRDGAFYICPAASDITYGDNGNRRRIGCWYKVDPDTVGQYTGLNDMNQKRIFEGDVVTIKKIGGIYIPRYLQERCLVMYERGRFSMVSLNLEPYDISHYAPDSEITVVGNGHDNSELLGGVEA